MLNEIKRDNLIRPEKESGGVTGNTIINHTKNK
jgi:hypothetical protein